MIAKQPLQIVAALALFCAMGTAPQARAQTSPSPSRSSLLEAQRRARMQKRESPKRSSVEQGLTKFDQAMLFAGKIQRGWHGVHLAGGDFPRRPGRGGRGSAIGFRIYCFRDGELSRVIQGHDGPRALFRSLAQSRPAGLELHRSIEVACCQIEENLA